MKKKTKAIHTCEPPTGFWEQEANKCINDLQYMYDSYFAIHPKQLKPYNKALKQFVENEIKNL